MPTHAARAPRRLHRATGRLHRTPRRLHPAFALALLAASLAGCQTGRPEITGSTYPTDYRDRHPIKLADAPRTLDLFVQGGGLDARARIDLADFVAEHRRFGNGPLVAQVPVGTGNGAAVARAVATVREAAGGRVAVSSYGPADPEIASPIRLTFRRLQAGVASTCGLWPQDLGVSDFETASANVPYWNQGCATQNNFAAQIADPTDLVRPRHATAPDTLKRAGAIEALRGGKDPSTSYRQDGQNRINTTLGQ